MSNQKAIFWFLKCHRDDWFSVRDVSKCMDLSIDRTRKHLTLLVLEDKIDTKVDGWRNIYRFRR